MHQPFVQSERPIGTGPVSSPVDRRTPRGDDRSQTQRTPMPRLPPITEDATTWFAVASSLTARDRELLAHLVNGHSTAQIATAMTISTNTVRTRVRRLRRRLDTAATGDAAS